MRIDIKLDDPRYCDGCPCLNEDYEEGESCNLGYDIDYQKTESGKWHNIRPQKCIDEHGEQED